MGRCDTRGRSGHPTAGLEGVYTKCSGHRLSHRGEQVGRLSTAFWGRWTKGVSTRMNAPSRDLTPGKKGRLIEERSRRPFFSAMAKPPKTKTAPGLGEAGTKLPRMDSAEMKRVRDSFRQDPEERTSDPGKRIRDSVRREDPNDDNEDPSTAESRMAANRSDHIQSKPPTARRSWGPDEPLTHTRRRPSSSPPTRSGRPPVTVDEVGTAAVKLARTGRRESAPRLVASRSVVAKAPIDTRSAFVLSLVDGRNSYDAIIDMAGMPEDEVKAILERLARLGLIALP